MDESKNAPIFLGRSIDRSIIRSYVLFSCDIVLRFVVQIYTSCTQKFRSIQCNSIQFNSLRCGVVWVPAVRGWMADTVHKTFISVIGKHTA